MVAADTPNTTANSDASITTNVKGNAGDTLFVWVAQGRVISAAISTVTGHGSSNTPELITDKRVPSLLAISVYRVKLSSDLASGTTLTVTLDQTTSNRKITGAFCVPGLQDSTANVNAPNDAGTGTPTVGPGTASQTPAIMLAFFEHNATSTSDTGLPSTGFTELSDLAIGGTNSIQGYVEYQIMSSVSAVNPSFTPSGTTSTAWAGILLGYLSTLVTATATSVSSSSGTATGKIIVSGTASSTSASSGTATGTITRKGILASTSASSGTATGTVIRPAVNGTATSTSASSGTATGIATHHVTSGTATSTSASSGAATGIATHHVTSGTASSTSTSNGTATGTITRHVYLGIAASTSASSGAATGKITRKGVATSTSASAGLAAGVASSSASAHSVSTSAGVAAGQVIRHVFIGTASSTSTSSGTATGRRIYRGVATSTSTSTGSATGRASVRGVAISTSVSSGFAMGITSLPIPFVQEVVVTRDAARWSVGEPVAMRWSATGHANWDYEPRSNRWSGQGKRKWSRAEF